MKVVHVVGGDLRVGAHLGALWLHRGLCSLGVDSWMLTSGATCGEERTTSSLTRSRGGASAFRSRIDRLVSLTYAVRQDALFSTGLSGGRVSDHPLVRSADIVHLHWIARNVIRLSDLTRLSVPVVWTLRDMWPFTGGCHYALECTRYHDRCGYCPQLGSHMRWDLAWWLQRAKRRCMPADLVCVGISEWLTDCARRSSVLANGRALTIPNCVDTQVFRPLSKAAARVALGLPIDRQIVLAGAASMGSYYKGFDLLMPAISRFMSPRPQLVLFGRFNGPVRNAVPSDTILLGYLNDPEKLRLAYSAADVFVAPYRQEAFGKTLAEALACGTPVVCFDATGPRDIVEHLVCGYRARPFEAEDLHAGIRWVLDHDNRTELRRHARERACKHFSQPVIAGHYRDLYESILTHGAAVAPDPWRSGQAV